MHYLLFSFTIWSKKIDIVNSRPCQKNVTKLSLTDFDQDNSVNAETTIYSCNCGKVTTQIQPSFHVPSLQFLASVDPINAASAKHTKARKYRIVFITAMDK